MLPKEEIRVGTKVKSTMYGVGEVVKIIDLNEPLHFYPYWVKFVVAQVSEFTCSTIVPFDAEGFSVRQRSDEPDGVFYNEAD